MVGTFWALVPAILAIALALLTKEVYFSLLAGIIAGALFFTNFHVGMAIETTVEVMSSKVAGNIGIVIFLVLLGMVVALMTKSGASKAYGDWASSNITTKRGALGATAGLGVLIFVDDYFNCLTVGTIMKPVTDRYQVTRAKLAYIIDATAAPICIIAPISSWAAAVTSSMPDTNIDGFKLFLKTIPFNLYALLTLGMIVFLIISQMDFAKMKRYEIEKAGSEKKVEDVVAAPKDNKKGHVSDLIIPIACLILFCILAMLYTGGILEGKNIVSAFADCNSSLSLVIGSFFTIIVIALLYLPRKILTFTQFTDSLVEGFKAMVPAILILTFAWTLSGICGDGYMEAGTYVSELVNNSQMTHAIIPVLFFLVALGLAFATGTSWGTFGILIPIVIAIFGNVESTLLVISVSAVMAGAVCGDHISPISDTTILSSTGAGCNHIDHVSTQIPYALTVCVFCVLGYLVAGFTENLLLTWLVGFGGLFITLFVIYKRQKAASPAK
ncbi:Na+/H+ antiporter NhaC family protein [Anaerolentibacter hominis]|uniref:Na+/H+ antiporter NhaC family protein n=1 Tax=Anaerolentibacter hominis TaxID=3079009 RepID=UPI0031B8AE53